MTVSETEIRADDAKAEAKRASVNAIGLLVQISGPAYHALLARALGVGGYGLYTWAISFVEAVSVLVLFGMDLTVRRYVGEAIARGRKDETHAIVGSALRLVWVLGGALIVAMYFAAPALAAWQGKPGLVTPLRILSAIPILFHTTTLLVTATQSAHVMKYGLWTRSALQPLLLFAFLGLALWKMPGTTGPCLGIDAAFFGTNILSAIFYRREFGSLRPLLRSVLTTGDERRLLRFGAPLVVAALFWTVVGKVDLALYGSYASAEDVGVFAGCLLFASSIGQTKGAFDVVVSSLIPHALARNDAEGLRASLRRLTRWTAFVVTPIFVAFGGFSDALLQVLGAGFVRGAGVLSILAFGQLIGAYCIAGWLIPMSGRTRLYVITAFVFATLDVVLLLVLIPRYGIYGAAIASSVAYAASQIALVVQVYVLTNVQPFSRSLAPIMLGGIGAIVLGRLAMNSVPGVLFFRFLAGGAVAAIVYFGVVLLGGLEDEEREIVRGLFRSRSS